MDIHAALMDMDDPAPPSEEPAGSQEEGGAGDGEPAGSDQEGDGDGVGPLEGSPPSPGAPPPSPPPQAASPAPFRKFQSRRVLSYQTSPPLGGTPLSVGAVAEGSSVGLLASIKNRIMPESEEVVADLDETQLAAVASK